MEELRTIEELAAWRGAQRGRIGFVPTMGALHEGHVALVRRARERAESVIASVFVNPTQFGPGEDLDAYPRREEEDARLLASVGCDALFVPGLEAIYPDGFATSVRVGDGMGEALCGAQRPGHFEGVATVVARLFGLVRPDLAVFGEKDFQQLAIIRRMTRDLALGVEIVGAPTVREPSGLAMSSRNAYLSEAERALAARLSSALGAAARAWEGGERRAGALQESARDELGELIECADYISLVDPRTLRPIEGAVGERGAVLALAVRVGAARLIDNVWLGRGEASA